MCLHARKGTILGFQLMEEGPLESTSILNESFGNFSVESPSSEKIRPHE